MAIERLGELLIDAGLITASQLNAALAEQQQNGDFLGDVLIHEGLITEEQLIEVLEFQLGIPQVRLSRQHIDPAVVRIVPDSFAKRYQVVPIRKEGAKLFVAMVNPLDYYAIDDLRMTTGLLIEPVIATREDIRHAINRYYNVQGSLEAVIQSISEEAEQVREEDISRENAPVVQLLNQIIAQAVDSHASDIHIDPQPSGVHIRFRIDGVLRTEQVLPKSMESIIVARVKILANQNIAEHRLPQDGRFQFPHESRRIDIRVSTLPTAFGEKVVLRVLDVQSAVHNVRQLGFSKRNLEVFMNLIQHPNGAVLATGPTGSGKTSTLYAALRLLASEQVNVITVEDPVEYEIEGVNQVHVNTSIGLTFARGLRAILRQDPDIIMVGEIRDNETAEIAMRSALTGHLVFSTLHTKSAASSITRLIDMGVEPYMVSSAVIGIISQRLVRRVCPECKTTYHPTEAEQELLNGRGIALDNLVHGIGCNYCGHTGYRGRMAIQEVMQIDRQMSHHILERLSDAQYEALARERGMIPLLHDGLEKAAAGLTTVEEVLKVTVHDPVAQI